MRHRHEAIAIIPARGGSRGIPRKNLQDLCGLPLLAYSILVARAAKRVCRVVVSTDDEEIAKVSLQFGAEVPFLRPADISGDKASIGDAVNHMLDGLKQRDGYVPDMVATMYPTHPFRSPELVDYLLDRIAYGYQSVVTVRSIPLSSHAWCVLEPNGKVRCLKYQQGIANTALRAYGLFEAYSVRPSALGVYIHPLATPEELIDIDDPEDLELARIIVQEGLYRLEVV